MQIHLVRVLFEFGNVHFCICEIRYSRDKGLFPKDVCTFSVTDGAAFTLLEAWLSQITNIYF